MDRLLLQEILEMMADHVYFQPPANLAIQYPCIIYQRDSGNTQFADNVPYAFAQRYKVTVVDRNPDSDIPKKVAGLPTCLHVSFFVKDGLNQDIFTLYF